MGLCWSALARAVGETLFEVGCRFLLHRTKTAVKRLAPRRPRDYVRLGKYAIEEHRTPRSKQPRKKLSVSEVEMLQKGRLCWNGSKWEVKSGSTVVGYAHHDLTVFVDGEIHRWAIPGGGKKGWRSVFPGKGERALALAQPRHYHLNPRVIRRGYGKGVTRVVAKGRCLVVGDITPFRLRAVFENIPGEFVIHHNILQGAASRTFSLAPKYKMRGPFWYRDIREDVDALVDQADVLEVKKDGAHGKLRMVVRGGRVVDVAMGSYREDKRLGQVRIDWTLKLGHVTNNLMRRKVSMPDGVYEFGIEAWSKSGLLATTNALQSDPVKAFCSPHKPYVYVHGVHRLPFPLPRNRREFHSLVEWLHKETGGAVKKIPFAVTSSGKRNLLAKAYAEPAVDGVVLYPEGWPSDKPTKIKFQIEWNGHVVGFQPRTGSHEGLVDPIVLCENGKRVVGGTVATHAQLRDMAQHPERWLGAPAEVLVTADYGFQPQVRIRRDP